MKALYLDIFSGISGDMLIGAMIDLGLNFKELEQALHKLGLDDYHLHVSRQERGYIAGTKFDVHLEHDHDGHSHHEHKHHHHEHEHEHEHHDHGHHHHEHHHHHHHEHHGHSHDHDEHEHEHGRTFTEIRKLILGSDLSAWVKQKSVAVFQRVANAEGKIHGKSPEAVHFHEVGAVDSIIDIVGGCLALEILGKPRVFAGPVIEGVGTIQCAHGRFPLPAPATLEILAARGVGVTQCDEPHELVTPTGAALLAEFAESFGPIQNFVAEKIGYGLGTRENKTRPNVLRAMLGNMGESHRAHDWETDTISVVETNIDDLNPEILGGVIEKALAAGALDAFHTPVHMKKNRPGILLTILCSTNDADRFSNFLLRETSAFGVRRHTTERRKLRREIVQVNTPFGQVAVKVGRLDGQTVQVSPEYESCKTVADAAGVPLKQVYEAAVRATRT